MNVTDSNSIIKMILAWIVAIFFAFTTTGCGKVEDKDSSETESKSAAADSSDGESAADDENSNDGDSEEQDKAEGDSSKEEQKPAEEPKPSGSMTIGRINPKNLIVNADYLDDNATRPDDDTLIFFAELALRQYEACLDQNPEMYLDTISFNGLMNTKSAEEFCTFLEEYENEPNLGEAESEVLWYNIILLSFMFEDDNTASMDFNTAVDQGKTVEWLRDYTADMTVEKASPLFDIGEMLYGTLLDREYGVSDDAFFADPSAYRINDPVVYIELDLCDVTESGTFIEFDMELIDGDHCIEFDEVVAWMTDSGAGILANDVRCSPNEYGVTTLEEVLALMNEGQAVDDARANAKIIYNAAAKYIYDNIDLQEIHLDYDELFASRDFDEATSEKGLDISGSRPKSKGDAFLYDAAKESGINSGFIYIGRDKNIDQDFNIFIQWKESKDSELIGQYPCYFDYYEADIKWGSYYYSKRDGV